MSEQEKKQNTVAEVLVKCLENEGVKYVFGIPGEENLDMMNALEKSDIRVIVVRHEQGAAFMADMYGRLTGKAGVCFSTLGPGATNLITGTADANSDGAPLIAITGQVGTERMHLTSHQYLDLVELFAPITKRSKQIVNPNSVMKSSGSLLNMRRVRSREPVMWIFPRTWRSFRSAPVLPHSL